MDAARSEKREYVTPSLEDLGPMHALTLKPDGRGKKPIGTVDGPHGPKTHQLGS
jgi:hypothetical protein